MKLYDFTSPPYRAVRNTTLLHRKSKSRNASFSLLSKLLKRMMPRNETIFEVTEDTVGGGYSASALGYGIHTLGHCIEEVRRNAFEAVDCYFDETMEQPELIRLHFVRDETR